MHVRVSRATKLLDAGDKIVAEELLKGVLEG